MSSEIIVNADDHEVRLAFLTNGVIKELYIERKKDRGIVGNIYKGKILKVLPGMQVAFVDIGLEKAGFLYVSDIDPSNNVIGYDRLMGTDISEGEGDESPEEWIKRTRNLNLPIEELVQEGQELLIQVTKDPLGTKGARITSYITLPGRYLVFMPTISQVGVSRKIEDEKERKRLKEIITELQPPGAGFIVRTVSEGKDWEEFISDINYLKRMWEDIRRKNNATSAPALIHNDLNLILRCIRDLFTMDVEGMVIDSRSDYERCVDFADKYIPEIKERIELYAGKEPLFDLYGIEIEIERALGTKVWLKSGGYIIVEQTEALTAIDVNTGKYVGKRNQDETILKTNLEATKEIVYQIQLRNIGGLIIIDFIDMEKERHKEKVYQSLDAALKGDRARTNIMKISEFGLVEMTRKRSRDSLNRILCQPCPYCEGRGSVKSKITVCYEIFKEINRLVNSSGTKKILLNVSQAVAGLLLDEESRYIDKMEKELKIGLVVKADKELHQEQYDITPI